MEYIYIDGSKRFNTSKDAKTVAQYVVSRLADLGITHSFTVPGDFAFPIDRALINNPILKNINSASELNASYAADGYAREKGAAILCTTYAVGELSAINGVMGAKAENNVIFHLVGAPGATIVAAKKQVHHTFGDGIFGQFAALSAAAACVSAVITPDNAVLEMNRVIYNAFKFRQPAYITIAMDKGNLSITDTTPEDSNCNKIISETNTLEQAIEFITKKIQSAKSIVVLPCIKLDRYGLTSKAISLIEKLNVPFAIMPHDKAVIDQTHKQYYGLYAGELSDEGVSEFVESVDLVLDLGGVFWSDFNTSCFTTNLDLKKVLTLAPLFVQNSETYFSDLYLGEVIDRLLSRISDKKSDININKYIGNSVVDINDKNQITLESLYSQLSTSLQKDDVLVVETGSSSINMPKLSLPSGVKYHNQTLWGSIGWATPAALGVALASPEKRTILVTGEGSHQLTLNELGVMGRYDINPIIICINNDGYMVERALETDPNPEYDDLAQLNYSMLPAAFGCNKWRSFKVKNNLEFKQALQIARELKVGTYIEVITERYDYGTSLQFYNNHITEMYK